MKTRTDSFRPGIPVPPLVLLALATLSLNPSTLSAAAAQRNPASMLYVTEVGGEALIDTGDAVDDLTRRSVYTAQGSVIETKRTEAGSDPSKNLTAMVYSNGTGAAFDADTRVEVKRFVQEPFTPNRADADVEPSISQTQAFVSRGSVGLCTSKLVAGSSMNYSTSLGSVNIRGKKVVIEAGTDATKISMLEGESTVRGGTMDQGGITLKVGQQAVIRRGPVGMPNIVQVQPIPPAELSKLDDKVAMACMAKKTVYFEVRERTVAITDRAAVETVAAETAPASSSETPAAGSTETAAGVSTETAAGASTGTAAGAPAGTATGAPTGTATGAPAGTATGGSAKGVAGTGTFTNEPAGSSTSGSTAFTPVSAFTPVPKSPAPGSTVVIREIVPVAILPTTLPVEYTVSTARIGR